MPRGTRTRSARPSGRSNNRHTGTFSGVRAGSFRLQERALHNNAGWRSARLLRILQHGDSDHKSAEKPDLLLWRGIADVATAFKIFRAGTRHHRSFVDVRAADERACDITVYRHEAAPRSGAQRTEGAGLINSFKSKKRGSI